MGHVQGCKGHEKRNLKYLVKRGDREPPVFDFAHHQDGEILEEQVETQNEGREEGEVRTEGKGQAGENACFLRGGGKGEARAKRKGSDGARATGSRCPRARKDRGAAG